MDKNKKAFLSVSMLVANLLLAVPSAASEPVAGTRLLETIAIQGVTLSMSPRQAFDHLKSAGFQAGNINSFAEWEDDGIEFVRGTYGSPDGFWSVTVSRSGEQIIRISETFNAPGMQLDAEAEIGAVKRHFGFTDETRQCAAPRPNSGTCSARDAENGTDAKTTYFIQVLPGMRSSSAGRVNRQETH